MDITFAITYLAAGGILAIVMALAKDVRLSVFKKVSIGLLSPLGVIFGLMVVFSVAEVGSDIDHANMAVDYETSAIRMVQFVLSLQPRSEWQTTAQREIVARLENAMDVRRQRIILSRSSVNWVLSASHSPVALH